MGWTPSYEDQEISRLYKQTLDDSKKIRELEEKNKQLRTEISELTGLNNAYYELLGPNGKMLADNWRDNGIKSFHATWGEDAVGWDGEKKAKYLLDLGEIIGDKYE